MAQRETYKGLASEGTLYELLVAQGGGSTPTAIPSGSTFDSFEFTLTRPANTTPYTLGDCIADVAAAQLKFTDVAIAALGGVRIDNITAYTNDTGLAGKSLRINFYNAAPTTPIADNSPMTVDVANSSKRKGVVPISFGTGIYASVASELYSNLVLNPVDKSIYIQVETDAFTPSANSTWITFKISVTRTN